MLRFALIVAFVVGLLSVPLLSQAEAHGGGRVLVLKSQSHHHGPSVDVLVQGRRAILPRNRGADVLVSSGGGRVDVLVQGRRAILPRNRLPTVRVQAK